MSDKFNYAEMIHDVHILICIHSKEDLEGLLNFVPIKTFEQDITSY